MGRDAANTERSSVSANPSSKRDAHSSGVSTSQSASHGPKTGKGSGGHPATGTEYCGRCDAALVLSSHSSNGTTVASCDRQPCLCVIEFAARFRGPHIYTNSTNTAPCCCLVSSARGRTAPVSTSTGGQSASLTSPLMSPMPDSNINMDWAGQHAGYATTTPWYYHGSWYTLPSSTSGQSNQYPGARYFDATSFTQMGRRQVDLETMYHGAQFSGIDATSTIVAAEDLELDPEEDDVDVDNETDQGHGIQPGY
ncbi:hypothetical protein F4780DRAFT_725752 [Xylariomycetidae sp. FL0641]|nr:hypothetical protein F4780DRAFT_725752 [Xylariomycetidae sp. FL0641]